MLKHESLIGNKYGRLKVVEKEMAKRKDGYSIIKWVCKCDCGNTSSVTTTALTRTKHPTRSCGCIRLEAMSAMKLDKNPAWKGGRFVNDGGYVMIWKPEHPNAKKIGYISEHRLVMSEVIGRPLVPGENVHHINGDKMDNNPNNLELWNTSQPSGQRIEDKIKWAKEILKLYDK